MKPLKKEWIIGTISMAFGAFFHFMPNNTLRVWGLTLGLRHNDHVIIGSVLLIIAFACFYKIFVKKILEKKEF